MESSTPGEFADPVLSSDAVLALVKRHVQSARELTFVDESGRKGRAYFVDDDIVLKTQRPRRLRTRVIEEFETSLEKEFFFLQQIEREPSIPAPGALGYGRDGQVEYLCMTRVPGVNLRRAELSGAERLSVLH